MKGIKISAIPVGVAAATDYFSDNDELIIAKGESIRQMDIEVLTRRGVEKLYVREPLTATIPEPEKTAPPPPADSSQFQTRDHKALELPAFREIRPGKRGFNQLINSKYAFELDNIYRAGHAPDTPAGPPLAQDQVDPTHLKRTEESKERFSHAYHEMLARMSYALDAIADGMETDASDLRACIERCVELYLADRNVLLSLATTQSPTGEYLYHHACNATIYTVAIAIASDYSREQVIEIGMGALLHDVGMFIIPSEIRFKKEKLLEEERCEINKHPLLGLHLLEKIKDLPSAVPFAVYQCHERENGTGYPKMRSARFIHRYSKIVQVADMYEALSSLRPYRESHMPYQALEIIIKLTKQGIITGEYVKSLISCTSLFPIGSIVELNDHQLARVIAANNNSYAKPIVMVLTTARGQFLSRDAYLQVDLSRQTDLHVIRTYKYDYLPRIQMLEGF
jgi:HD-GYP domain-containing protein (c-di-GMP phosphodiesterase class II)